MNTEIQIAQLKLAADRLRRRADENDNSESATLRECAATLELRADRLRPEPIETVWGAV